MATALNAQELSNVLYSIARLMPCITDTRPDVLEVLLQEIDRRVALGQGQHDQPGSTRRNRRNQLPHQPESSSTKCLASQTDWAVTAQVEQPVMSGLMCHSPYGRPGVGGLSPAQLFNPRDLAMLAWSLAILAPASPTLRRILTAAVASVNISIADAPSTATDKGDAADAGGTELGELQTQPYNLFGLVQLYGANYAACLAAATTGASGGDVNSDKQEPKARVLEMDVTEGDGDGDCSYSESCGDGGCNECGDGGGGGGGGRSDAAAALVRAAAAAMLQAQRAAEAIGGAPASSINECNSNSDGPYTRKAASAAGEEEDGRRRRGGGQGGRGKGGGDTSGQSGVWREMVRFGPLGACPPLFRACRDAWFLNTASTKPSDLQTAVAAVLRNRRLGGGGGGGTIDSSASGSCGGGVAGQTRGVVFVAEEVLTPDRMLRVDLLVQYDGWLVLLEVDGPSHFAVELYGKQVNTSNGDSSSVSRIADATMRGRDGTGTGSNDDDGAVQDDLISATACPTSCGTENEENQCHGDADFSGRVDDGNEEEARLVTASAGKVRSARGDSKLPAAAAVALRRQGLLRPLGDTVLRNRFLAASLGLRAAGFREGGPAVLTHTGANDPWVIESLLVQLPRGEGAKEEDGKGRLASTARSGEGGYGCAGLGMGRDVDAVGSTAGITGTNGSHGGGASDGVSAISSSGSGSGLVRGVALTTLSYADWNAAGNSPRDKWARCLQPLLVRCLG
ncbi:hypothetical protein Vretifemale_12339 [Volvox reticuliferus]|nr:hypothetical protein Vretifemale_12339 [Volvox reticuliferus]